MRIAVTGGAGLTGGEIVRLLVGEGHEVRALIRHVDQRDCLPDGAGAVIGDCRDDESIRSLVANVDCLIHCAGIVLAASMAEVVKVAGLQKLVALSTASASVTDHPHGMEYRSAEEQLLRACPDASFLRPTMIYGSERDRNLHHAVAFARRFRVLPLPGAGTARIQPIHYEDVAAASVALLAAPGRTIEAGGNQPTSLRDAALAIFAALGIRGTLVRIPIDIAQPFARVADALTSSRWVERLGRSQIDRAVDNSGLTKLGVRPRSFEQGLAQQVARLNGG